MAKFERGFEETHSINSFLSIKLAQPENRKKENDYIIYWNNTHQFSDRDLFELLLNNISNKKEAEEFIQYFTKSKFIFLNKDCIATNIQLKKEVIDYVKKLSIKDELKLALASMIFRCDIDNINYNCPPLNGCIRHFVQVLLLFGYKFDIDNWKIKTLRLINNNNTYIINTISHIGYPNNKYNINNNDFKKLYISIIR